MPREPQFGHRRATARTNIFTFEGRSVMLESYPAFGATVSGLAPRPSFAYDWSTFNEGWTHVELSFEGMLR
jgi:hypothetical protein